MLPSPLMTLSKVQLLSLMRADSWPDQCMRLTNSNCGSVMSLSWEVGAGIDGEDTERSRWLITASAEVSLKRSRVSANLRPMPVFGPGGELSSWSDEDEGDDGGLFERDRGVLREDDDLVVWFRTLWGEKVNLGEKGWIAGSEEGRPSKAEPLLIKRFFQEIDR
jgi:hypothetical protein